MPRHFKKGEKRPANAGKKKGSKNKKTIERNKKQLQGMFLTMSVSNIVKNAPVFESAVRTMHREARDGNTQAFRLLCEYRRDLMEMQNESQAMDAAIKLNMFAELEAQRSNLTPEIVQEWVCRYGPMFSVSKEASKWFEERAEFYYRIALQTTAMRLTARNTASVEKVHRVIRIMADTTKLVTSTNIEQYHLWISEFAKQLEQAGLSDWIPEKEIEGNIVEDKAK